MLGLYFYFRPSQSGWQTGRLAPSPVPPELPVGVEITDIPPPLPPRNRIPQSVIDNVQYNADRRRQIGKGIVGKFFKHSYRTDRMNSEIKAQIDEFDDHR